MHGNGGWGVARMGSSRSPPEWQHIISSTVAAAPSHECMKSIIQHTRPPGSHQAAPISKDLYSSFNRHLALVPVISTGLSRQSKPAKLTSQASSFVPRASAAAPVQAAPTAPINNKHQKTMNKALTAPGSLRSQIAELFSQALATAYPNTPDLPVIAPCANPKFGKWPGMHTAVLHALCPRSSGSMLSLLPMQETTSATMPCSCLES